MESTRKLHTHGIPSKMNIINNCNNHHFENDLLAAPIDTEESISTTFSRLNLKLSISFGQYDQIYYKNHSN